MHRIPNSKSTKESDMMLAIITELLDLAVELFMTSWQRRRNPTLPPITNILFISKKTQVPADRHLAMRKL